MNIRISLLLLFCTVWLTVSAQDRNLLSGKYSVSELQDLLIPLSRWEPFPRIDDRQAWEKADRETLQTCIRYAENHLDYDWPTVPATLSLLIARTGNRSEYQAVSYRKRIVLANMILAEIAENEGRFVDPVINGIWSICEESWWGASAHLPQTKEYAGLMDVTQPFVDLYAGVTAGILAWADYFLGEKFDAVSPQIRKRIHHEVQFRILQPLMNQYHGWMGRNASGRAPNNWNPWICSNWLTCALLLEKDPATRAAMTAKALKVLDGFVNPYPEDGGCSEGPGYWGAAVGLLFQNVALLNVATSNAFDYVYEDEKFRNMGRFIYRVQISEQYAVNFADAGPRTGGANNLAYRFGKAIGDEDMMRYAAWYRGPSGADHVRGHFAQDFFDLFIMDEIRNAPQGLLLPKDVWLPVLQIAVARDRQGTAEGFFVAAKGGSNNESHNHNDVGNFIVYYDGLPLLIDIGSPKYTAKTFTDRRYEIWNLCSDYHNLPTINGVTQSAGPEYRASGVTFKQGSAATEFSLDIAGAYPQTAAVNRWQRTVTLNRNKSVTVRDRADLRKAESVTQHLMTCYPAEVTGKGEVTIRYRDKEGKDVPLLVRYNGNQMEVEVEKIRLETESDEAVRANWGDTVHRINFKVIAPRLKDTYLFEIKKK
jgi:hypothetical protein